MWIKSREGLFNSTAYRSIVAEHFDTEGPEGKPMSVVIGHFIGRKVREKCATSETDPFDMIAVFTGEDCFRRADQAVEHISAHLGWQSKRCVVG